jgi:cell division protein FtsW
MSLFAELTQGVNAIRPGRTTMRNYDLPLFVVVGALLCIGVLMVYSASIALADGPLFSQMSRYSFVARQAVFMAAGLMLAVLVWLTPLTVVQRLTLPLFGFTAFLLVLVFIPGIGYEANGANRWIDLGPVNFQPSELMKVVAVLFAADYVVRKQQHMDSLINGFLPMALAMAGVGILLLLEPDLGALIVIMAIAMGVLFLGGINAKVFSGLVAVLLSIFFLLIWLSPWRRARLFAYLDPWNPDNVYGSSYQLSHSLIAIGRGEWFGVGLGSSIEKLHYLPEAHTDFIISVIGEELGFMGIAMVVVLFAVLVARSFEIGRQAIAMERVFSGLVAQGVGIWFGVQSFINIGVCLGVLPTKGLTLPLISYGGSGLVMNLVALALVARVDYENRVLMRGGRT